MHTQAQPSTSRYQEKRESVLNAAAMLFNQRGVKGATLSDIAGSVGLVTNSVTYYYRKKEDLATACFLRTIEAYNELAVLASREASIEARVTAFYALLARLLADIELGSHVPIVTFNDIRALPSPHAEKVFAAYTDMFRHVRSLLKGPETSQLARDDLNARGHIVLSVAHNMRQWIGRYEVDEYPRVAQRLTDIVLHGLPAAGSGWQAAADSERHWRLGADNGGTSEAFLRAATALVNEQGYRGASVDKISARINVTKGSFYHHNDNKHDLISECFDRTFAVVRRALSLAEDGPGSGWSRACAAARALVRYQLSAEGPLLRATAVSALPEEVQRDRVRRTQFRLTERMTSVVVDGMIDGSIRPLDPHVAAQVTIAAINAAAELQRWVASATVDNAADVFVRPALQGVLCPGMQPA
ncbi:MAG TPA: TetR/AcrR family transcriptional regulator [Burkholderiaceae bacterium]|nr:TetR/AcrR family transcriptional regulator [Burkholderiaceae bacterium]